MLRATFGAITVALLATSATHGRVPQVEPDRETLLLAVDRLLADRSYPDAPDRLTEAEFISRLAADRQLLQRALASRDGSLRRLAVRSVGRFENPLELPVLVPYLDDPDDGVRAEAAHAIAQSMHRSRDDDVEPAVAALLRRLEAGPQPDPRPLLTALGRLRMTRARTQEIERRLLALDLLTEDSLQRWLEPVLLRDRSYAVTAATRAILMRLVTREPRLGPDPFALRTLGPTLSDEDAPLVLRAATYRCPPVSTPECGWSTRHAGIDGIDPARPIFDQALDAGRRDAFYVVRMAALRKTAAAIATRQTCAPLLDAFADPMPIVAMEAMRLADPTCEIRAEIAERLARRARELAGAGPGSWHVPARAFESLARFDPAGATTIVNEIARGHRVWQVRATAARVATALKLEDALKTLVADTTPNVRTEALDGLARLRSPAVTDAAHAALESPDYQLVRSAAIALQHTRDPERSVARLVAALERLTKDGADTSRDPRVAILERLKAMAAPGAPAASRLGASRESLLPFTRDVDPRVAALAGDVIEIASGTRPPVLPRRRWPMQPTADELRRLPESVVVTMADGERFRLRLLRDDAPLTVARFVTLAAGHYYDGLTFHRIAPLFVVQGGGPGANEYSGHARYMRDEISPAAGHVRGAVGISTRGRDTGDAQIFIDLIDVPRLNYDYTVFAHVVNGMDVVDRLLEGATIRGTGPFSTDSAQTGTGVVGRMPD